MPDQRDDDEAYFRDYSEALHRPAWGDDIQHNMEYMRRAKRNTKQRMCLRCQEPFKSFNSGNRICRPCKEKGNPPLFDKWYSTES